MLQTDLELVGTTKGGTAVTIRIAPNVDAEFNRQVNEYHCWGVITVSVDGDPIFVHHVMVFPVEYSLFIGGPVDASGSPHGDGMFHVMLSNSEFYCTGDQARRLYAWDESAEASAHS